MNPSIFGNATNQCSMPQHNGSFGAPRSVPHGASFNASAGAGSSGWNQPGNGNAAFGQRIATLLAADSLGLFFEQMLQGPTPQPAGPLSLATPLELSRGDDLSSSGTNVRVGQDGDLTYHGTTPLKGDTGNGCSAEEMSQKVKIANGMIDLPNGQKIPFGNTGVIVKMADGTQMAVGRTSPSTTQQSRWVVAGEGQEIPTSPPGATNVYTLDQQGDLVSESVQ